MRRISQSDGIRRAIGQKPAKVIAVTSGKGGVGKTNVAANLAVALGMRNHDVMLLDADFGLANIDVLLGLQPRFNLSHVISGETDLESTIVVGPKDVRIVPASSGNQSMTDLPPVSQAAVIQAFADLSYQPDYLLVDTAAGISECVARLVQAAQHAVIVVCDEPSSITDAYALIKVFSRHYGITHFQIITNQTRDHRDGRQLFVKIRKVTDLYLDVVLRHLGNVPHDVYLRRAVQEQRAVVDAYPKCWSAEAFRNIANAIEQIRAPEKTRGSIEFFFERLLKSESACTGSFA